MHITLEDHTFGLLYNTWHLHNTLYRKLNDHFSACHWHHHFPLLSCHPYDLQFGSFYAIGVSIHCDQSCCLHYLLSPSTTPHLVYPARFVMQPAVVITIMWSLPYHFIHSYQYTNLLCCTTWHHVPVGSQGLCRLLFVRFLLFILILLSDHPKDGFFARFL